MKTKIISLLLSAAMLMTLVSCGKNKDAVSDSDAESWEIYKASEWNPEVPERDILQSHESMCGVFYMNYSYDEFFGMKKNRKYYNKIFKSTGSIKKFPLLKHIPNENIVSTPMGAEVYLIIPTDPEAQVEVYLLEFDEETFTAIRSEEPVYSSSNGNPIVLQCNYGDLFSDAEIVIIDSDGKKLRWSPAISLKDGMVNNQTDDGKIIYDFTEYETDVYEEMDD